MRRFVEGTDRGQSTLFPECLEDWIGASAITLYFINGIVGFQPLATQLVGGDVGRSLDSHLTPGVGSFLAHAVGLLLAVALAGFLYQRKIFLRV